MTNEMLGNLNESVNVWMTSLNGRMTLVNKFEEFSSQLLKDSDNKKSNVIFNQSLF